MSTHPMHAPDDRSATPRLELRDLVVARGGRRVLDAACLAVSPGEMVVIRGPSGSGKSTLLRAAAALVEPESGSVWLEGADARGMDPPAFRARVAYVPQAPAMFEGSVADNVAAGPRLRGRAPGDDEVRTLLVRAGLDPSLALRRARDLSGGERQRVAIARALANDPAVLLFDEPTSALDPVSATHVLELLRTLAGDGRAVVVVTHAEDHARMLGGTRYVCEAGRLTRETDGAA